MNLMNAVGMHLDTSQITFRPRTPLVGAVVGVVVTLISAYLPARRAGKVSPMAALRDATGGIATAPVDRAAQRARPGGHRRGRRAAVRRGPVRGRRRPAAPTSASGCSSPWSASW